MSCQGGPAVEHPINQNQRSCCFNVWDSQAGSRISESTSGCRGREPGRTCRPPRFDGRICISNSSLSHPAQCQGQWLPLRVASNVCRAGSPGQPVKFWPASLHLVFATAHKSWPPVEALPAFLPVPLSLSLARTAQADDDCEFTLSLSSFLSLVHRALARRVSMIHVV